MAFLRGPLARPGGYLRPIVSREGLYLVFLARPGAAVKVA
jgi:hypothetical protein